MSRLHTLKRAQLKERLEELCASLDVQRALSSDPIRFVRARASERERELTAIFAALLAYGRVGAISKAIEEVLGRMGEHPYEALLSDTPQQALERFEGFVYRFTRGDDLAALWLSLGELCRAHGGVGEALRALDEPGEPELLGLLTRLYDELSVGLERRLKGEPEAVKGRCRGGRGYAHLLSNPRGGSALKRLNMLMRWMVRGPDEVDLGQWSWLGAHRLTIPLDAHVFRTARALGLTQRGSASWRAAREVSEGLACLDPLDPTRYDFALAHLGISGECVGYRVEERCARCALEPLCTLKAKAPKRA
jgi:uncharacterized protein (TIGR02757 family)